MDETRRVAGWSPRGERRATDPLIGRVINDRYRVLSVIAHGGMGKVYRAEQAPLGRLVALKVLSPDQSGDYNSEFHKRFFLEASIASRLKHPNTVTIFDYGRTDDDVFYIAMELLEGRTLHRLLRDEGPLGPERMVHIASQICCALREAHALGVVHRDLKPANVYIVRHGDENEFAKVLDFGLVKHVDDGGEQLTKTGLFLGSPKYMAPEQIRGGPVDARVDVYALGVIMYEMLAGRVPFEAPNSVNVLMAHVHEPVPAISVRNPEVRVPPALEAVVQKCVAKQPDDRFLSMNDVLTALRQGLHGGPASFQSAELAPALPVSLGLAASAPLAQAPANTQQLAPFAQAAKPASSAMPLVVALFFAAAGVGGLFAFRTPSGAANDPPKVVAPPPVARAEPAAVAEPAHASAKEPSVLISLRSTPPGAMVVVGDREYGPTPTEVEWVGAEAAPGRELTFRFRRSGYRAMIVKREIRGDRLDIDVSFRDPTR